MTLKVAVGPRTEKLSEKARDFEQAIQRGGGQVVDLDQDPEGLVWIDGYGGEALSEYLAQNQSVTWIQLTFAGVDSFLGAKVFDPNRTWTSAKGVNAVFVAEHALALALAGLRLLPKRIKAQTWEMADGDSLNGQNVLILGGGFIGRQLVKLNVDLGAIPTVFKRSSTPIPAADVITTKDELHKKLSGALVVYVALALTPETTGIISQKELSCMSSKSWLINVGRGKEVVTNDLVRALETGQIAGAGLDVVDPEPLPDDHPLWRLPNCIITPHTADTDKMTIPPLLERVSRNVANRIANAPLEGLVDVGAGY